MADFSDECINIWRTLRAIVATGADQHWEHEGGRLSEFYTLDSKLKHEILGMYPHETPPIRAAVYGAPPVSLDDDEGWKRLDAPQRWQRESYTRAFKLSVLLDKAVKAQRIRARAPKVSEQV